MVVIAGGDPETIRLIAVEDLAAAVGVEGRWSVFDPTDLLTPAAAHGETPGVRSVDARRSA
jgi:hypothetical protein